MGWPQGWPVVHLGWPWPLNPPDMPLGWRRAPRGISFLRALGGMHKFPKIRLRAYSKLPPKSNNVAYITF